MMNNLLSEQQFQAWQTLVGQAQHIVIACHKEPDGDAIGSSCALYWWLKRHGKEHVTVIAPNYFPDFFKWLPGTENILLFEHHEAEVQPVIDQADLVIMVDHAELYRMAALGDAIGASTAPRIIFDHHPNPQEGIATLLVSEPTLSSACEVLLRSLIQIEGGVHLSYNEAVAFYMGMMTDTGAFTFASNRSEIFELISILLSCGIDKDQIYRNVFWTYSPERLRLMGYMLYVKMEHIKKYHTAVMTFTNAERRRFHTLKGDTEGFVNLPLQIAGMRLSIFLREDTEKPVIRVSLRSVGDFSCTEMASEFFHGGGHKNASGGEIWGTMDEALKIVHEAIHKYADKLK